MFFVYMIKSIEHNWYYVGSTENIERRLKQHSNGHVKSTKYRAPYELVYTEKYSSVSEARTREKDLKTNRSLKEDIIKKFGPIV